MECMHNLLEVKQKMIRFRYGIYETRCSPSLFCGLCIGIFWYKLKIICMSRCNVHIKSEAKSSISGICLSNWRVHFARVYKCLFFLLLFFRHIRLWLISSINFSSACARLNAVIKFKLSDWIVSDFAFLWLFRDKTYKFTENHTEPSLNWMIFQFVLFQWQWYIMLLYSNEWTKKKLKQNILPIKRHTFFQ